MQMSFPLWHVCHRANASRKTPDVSLPDGKTALSVFSTRHRAEELISIVPDKLNNYCSRSIKSFSDLLCLFRECEAVGRMKLVIDPPDQGECDVYVIRDQIEVLELLPW
jgi:hypothetical protein